MYFVTIFVDYFIEILIMLIIIRVFLSWIRTPPRNRMTGFIIDTTNPVLNIAKRITPRIGMIDISPIIAVIGLELIRSGIFYLLAYISL